MPNLGAPEIILILLVVLLLFGAKRMPDAARGLGRSLRIFKAETKGMNDDAKEATPAAPAEIPPATPDASSATPATPPAPAPQPAPAPEPGADR